MRGDRVGEGELQHDGVEALVRWVDDTLDIEATEGLNSSLDRSRREAEVLGCRGPGDDPVKAWREVAHGSRGCGCSGCCC